MCKCPIIRWASTERWWTVVVGQTVSLYVPCSMRQAIDDWYFSPECEIFNCWYSDIPPALPTWMNQTRIRLNGVSSWKGQLDGRVTFAEGTTVIAGDMSDGNRPSDAEAVDCKEEDVAALKETEIDTQVTSIIDTAENRIWRHPTVAIISYPEAKLSNHSTWRNDEKYSGKIVINALETWMAKAWTLCFLGVVWYGTIPQLRGRLFSLFLAKFVRCSQNSVCVYGATGDSYPSTTDRIMIP